MTGITVVNSEGWEVIVDPERFWIKEGSLPWREVTRAEFVAVEHDHGFHPKVEGQLATYGFSSGNTQGRITTGPIGEDQYVHDPEFRELAKTTRPPAVYKAKK